MRRLWIALLFIVPVFSASSMEESPDVKAWDARLEIFEKLAKEIDTTLRRNNRAVRRGVDNSRVEGILKSQIDSTNRKLKQRGAYLMAASKMGTPEKFFGITTPEIHRVLDKLNPYQREFAENSLINRKVIGRILHHVSTTYDGALPESNDPYWIDLNKPPQEPEAFNKFLTSFAKSKGTQYIAVVSRKIPLPDASYSLKSELMIEQKSSGEIAIFHERLKNRVPGMMAAQIYTEIPPAVVFVRKSELLRELKPGAKISHFVLDTYEDPVQIK